ncbi:MAG: hypothetical protein M0Z53_06015 [Thermaerobacter sp.]|nr:hypothetical protein [Thermaerobacter sp.]
MNKRSKSPGGNSCGGEEFLVLLAAGDAPQALAVADRIRQAVAADAVSIGAATPHRGLTDLTRWIAVADQALYRTQKHGRHQVVAGARDGGGDDSRHSGSRGD